MTVVDPDADLAAALGNMPEPAPVFARLAAGSGWQPIATAPRNGSDVLVWRQGGRLKLAFWAAHVFGVEVWLGMDRRLVFEWGEPTHWHPLPEPPRE